MTAFLHNIYGRKLGVDHNENVLAKQGLGVGSKGNQFLVPSPYTAVLLDDFVGDTLSTDNWLSAEGSDAQATAAILAGGIGGVARLTTGNAGSGVAADAVTVNGALQWQASNDNLVFETRIKHSRITNAYTFVGFTDVATGVEAPVTLSGTTFTTNASDAVGWMFDTAATTDTWRMVGVAANTDATEQDSAASPVAADYETLRVEIDVLGVAKFFRNGLPVGTAMTGALTPATDLCPVVYTSNLSGTDSYTLDVDYIYVSMDRAAVGGAA
tara:strand:- start:666 stop:1475 length:810 start_codon:yes stop_codon:yes gene_type:complete